MVTKHTVYQMDCLTEKILELFQLPVRILARTGIVCATEQVVSTLH